MTGLEKLTTDELLDCVLDARTSAVGAEIRRRLERLEKCEAALTDAAMSLDSYEQSCGQGRGSDEAFDIAKLLGYEDSFDEFIPWLKARRAALEGR